MIFALAEGNMRFHYVPVFFSGREEGNAAKIKASGAGRASEGGAWQQGGKHADRAAAKRRADAFTLQVPDKRADATPEG